MIMLMMAMDEKTEKPTPKKLRDAREKGQVVKSNDVNAAIILLGMFGALKLFGSYILDMLMKIISNNISNSVVQQEIMTIQDSNLFFFESSLSFFKAIAPILLFSVILAVMTNYFQVGFLLTTKTLKPNFGKINPISGMKRMFSMQAMFDMVKAAVKAIVIGMIAYVEFKKSFAIFPTLMRQNIGQSAGNILQVMQGILLKAGIALIIIAAADYFFTWWQHRKNLMMTKQEVKEEFKQLEGDPQIKAKIRQRQQQIGMARMMSDVVKATVVITNPTHFAVALKYEQDQDSAPIVVAKGQDYVALKIKEKAKEHRIEIVEDKPLARALYAAAEVGDAIPQEFFVAVAQVLAEIYKIKKR